MTAARYLIHVSDLHIGKGVSINRDDEFRQVFGRFAQAVAGYDPKEALVVVTGDVFERKDVLSAQEISLFDAFMTLLRDYDVLMIPGNHDAVVNNPLKMDLITPLAKYYGNITYLRDSCVRQVRGVNFIHVSVFDPATDLEIMDTLRANLGSVLLYHGVLNETKFANYMEMNSRITADMYAMCRFVLAGDIHQHMYVRGNVAYAGSLLQHDVTETHPKGFIVWDTTSGASTFTPVHNDYGQYKIDARSLSVEQITALPRANHVHRVSVIADAGCEQKIEALRAVFGRVDSVCKLRERLNVNPLDTQTDMLRKLLASEGASSEDTEQIVQMHTEMISEQPYRKWTILRVQFSNMYRYGADNCVQFSQDNTICGVIADNQQGKSTLLDVVVFGLFNVLLRGSGRGKTNDYATCTHVRIEFVVNGTEYSIDRTDYSTSCKQHVLMRAGENITEKSVTATYDKLKTIIGSVDEFLSTAMYYDSTHDLIRMSATARKTVLAELFGLYDKRLVIDRVRGQIKACNDELNRLGTEIAVTDVDKQLAEHCAGLEQLRTELAAAHELLQTHDALRRIAPRPLNTVIADIKQTMVQIVKLRQERARLEGLVMENVSYAPPAHGDVAALERAVGDHGKSEVIAREIQTLRECASCPNPRAVDLIQRDIDALTVCNADNIQSDPSPIAIMQEITALRAQLVAVPDVDGPRRRVDDLRAKTRLRFNADCAQCCSNKLALSTSSAHASSACAETCDELALGEQHLEAVCAQHQAAVTVNERLAREISELEHCLSAAMAASERRQTHARLVAELESAHIAARVASLEDTLRHARESEQACKQLRAIYMYEQYQLCQQAAAVRMELAAAEARLTALRQEYDVCSKFDYGTYQKYDGNTLRNEWLALHKRVGIAEHTLGQLEARRAEAVLYQTQAPVIKAKLARYEMYKKCVDTRGLITMVVKENLSKITERVNEILSTVTNFTISYDSDDNTVSFQICEHSNAGGKTHDVDTASGFQKFIISLVLRLVLTCALPSSAEFIFIDEGFGCMDRGNLERLNDLFAMLRPMYKFIFIISHLPEIQRVIQRPLMIVPHMSRPDQSYINNTPTVRKPHIAPLQLGTTGAPKPAVKAAPTAKPAPKTAVKARATAKPAPGAAKANADGVPDGTPDDTFKCSCGAQVKKNSKYGHMKSKKHMDAKMTVGVPAVTQLLTL